MKFTADWFSNKTGNFDACIDIAPDNKAFLEIGSFEGRATTWLVQEKLDPAGLMVCVDPYQFWPSMHTDLSGEEVHKIFLSNMAQALKDTQKFKHLHEPAYTGLARLICDKYEFDFIYVDGNHDPHHALQDGAMAWGLLKQGGTMLFDDYKYPHKPTGMGIDGFLNAFKGQYEIIVNNYQLGIQKK